MAGDDTLNGQAPVAEVIIHTLQQTVLEHERTIAALTQLLQVADGTITSEREARTRTEQAHLLERHELQTRLREAAALTRSVESRMTVVVGALREVVAVSLSDYDDVAGSPASERYDRAYTQARELLRVIDGQRPQ